MLDLYTIQCLQKWEDDEAIRLEKESELLRYVKGLIEKERKELLEKEGTDEEAVDTINYNIVRQLA